VARPPKNVPPLPSQIDLPPAVIEGLAAALARAIVASIRRDEAADRADREQKRDD